MYSEGVYVLHWQKLHSFKKSFIIRHFIDLHFVRLILETRKKYGFDDTLKKSVVWFNS
jgi:hypothetical protein